MRRGAAHRSFPEEDRPCDAFDVKSDRDREKERCMMLLCKFHPKCVRGDRCWFSHDPAQARDRFQVAPGEMDNTPTNCATDDCKRGCLGDSAFSMDLKGLACKQAAASLGVYGEPSGSPVQSRPSSSGSRPADKPLAGHQTKHRMCTYHLQGHCSQGSSCLWAHSPHELRHPPPPTRNRSSAGASRNAPPDVVGSEAREIGHLNGREMNGRMAALHLNAEEDEAPDSFCCPITHDILRDPVVACDGYSYERVAIRDWLQHHNTSPMTNEVLESKNLVPNRALLAAIRVLYN